MRLSMLALAGSLLAACSDPGTFGRSAGSTGASTIGGSSGTSGSSGASTSSSGASATGSSGTTTGSASSSSGGSSGSSCGEGCHLCGSGCVCSPGTTCPPSYDAGTNDAGSLDGGDLDAGAVDAGPYDAGVYIVEPEPNTYWCRIVQAGVLTALESDDAGCIGPLPACWGEAVPLEPEIHVPEPTQVVYLTEPVPAGPHWPCWAPWGVSHAHVALPTMRWLHNSEHAGVVLLYRCDPDAGLPDGGSCDAMAQPLIAFALDGGPAVPQDGDLRYLVTARPELPTSYAAIAWGWRLQLDAWDPAAVTCFAQAHLGAGPEELFEDPDPGACPQSYLP